MSDVNSTTQHPAADLCVALSSAAAITAVAEVNLTHLHQPQVEAEMLVTVSSAALRQMKVVCVKVKVIQSGLKLARGKE